MGNVHKTRNIILTAIAVLAFAYFLDRAPGLLNGYWLRILNLIAINAILGLSLNLIYGITGMFSLGHAGFMAIGAYVSALLVLSPAQKQAMWILDPIYPWLLGLNAPFVISIIVAGLVAALFGWLIALPVLRLGGDYLGIATLGFAEIIRILITNLSPLTNGSLGLKGIPAYTNLWMSWGCLSVVLLCTVCMLRSNFGNVLRAVRDDEVAARMMGVNTFRMRVLAFTLGCFGGGLGGALMGNLITTIDPKMFMITQTYNILMIVVVGGLGSVTGSLIGSALVTTMLEWLRFVENPLTIGSFHIPGIPGMRMVIFSLLLIVVIIFRREGIMGTREFSWDWFFGRKPKPRGKPEEQASTPDQPSDMATPPRPLGEREPGGEGLHAAQPVLELQDVSLRFGGLTAIDGLNMAIKQGQIVGLIGPNGAGKTSAFNVISGFYRATAGRVLFLGKPIEGLSPERVCRAGMSRTFQNIRLFGTETVLQNVMVGSWVRQRSRWWMTLLPFIFRSVLREEAEMKARAMELLGRVGLADVAEERASSLPYGAQRRLEIARALGTRPRFLLLDEPAAGMNPQESEELMRFIHRLRDEFKLTILLIEHDMKVVMNVCDHIHVLDQGAPIAEGAPAEVRANPRVIEAYLGAGAADATSAKGGA